MTVQVPNLALTHTKRILKNHPKLAKGWSFICGYLGKCTWPGWSAATRVAHPPVLWRRGTEKGGNGNIIKFNFIILQRISQLSCIAPMSL